MSLNIGILSIQGDIQENVLSTQAALDELGIDGNVIDVKTPEDVMNLDGLILPGGESTTIGQMSLVNGSMKILKEKNRKWHACSWNLCWNDYVIKKLQMIVS